MEYKTNAEPLAGFVQRKGGINKVLVSGSLNSLGSRWMPGSARERQSLRRLNPWIACPDMIGSGHARMPEGSAECA